MIDHHYPLFLLAAVGGNVEGAGNRHQAIGEKQEVKRNTIRTEQPPGIQFFQ